MWCSGAQADHGRWRCTVWGMRCSGRTGRGGSATSGVGVGGERGAAPGGQPRAHHLQLHGGRDEPYVRVLRHEPTDPPVVVVLLLEFSTGLGESITDMAYFFLIRAEEVKIRTAAMYT